MIIGNSEDFMAISFNLPCNIKPFFILLKFILIKPKNWFETAPQNSMIKGTLSILDTNSSLTGHIIVILSVSNFGPNLILYLHPYGRWTKWNFSFLFKNLIDLVSI